MFSVASFASFSYTSVSFSGVKVETNYKLKIKNKLKV